MNRIKTQIYPPTNPVGKLQTVKFKEGVDEVNVPSP